MKISTRKVALIAVFAALYYVLSLLSPTFEAAGVPNLTIQLGALTAAVLGFVFGPYLGALTALFGVLLTWVLPPSGMNPTGVPFLLSPPLDALAVGFIFYRKWKRAFAVFSMLILVFLFLPPAQPINEFWNIPVAVLWDKVIALALIIPTVAFAGRVASRKWLAVLFFVISFIGNQVDNMWGTDIFAVPAVYNGVFGMPVEAVRFAFLLSPFIYPALRIVQAFIATLIAVPLIIILKNTKWISQENSILDKPGINK